MRAALACALALVTAGACGGEGRRGEVKGERIAQVGERVLHREVVEMIADRDGVDEAEAEARAIETLRWVAMRDADASAEPLDPMRATQLRRAALARLTLEAEFEAKHGPEDIEDAIVDATLNDEARRSRHFHPKLHFVCQVIVRVPPKDDSGAPPEAPTDDPQWQRDAEAFGRSFARALDQRREDLAGERNCDLITKLYALAPRQSEDGRFELHFETGAYEVARKDLWVPEFVEALEQIETPGVVPPFHTKYGWHIAFVPRILEAKDVGDPADPAAQRKARAEALRVELLDGWRAETAFPRYLQLLRDTHVVRLAAGLEDGTP